MSFLNYYLLVSYLHNTLKSQSFDLTECTNLQLTKHLPYREHCGVLVHALNSNLKKEMSMGGLEKEIVFCVFCNKNFHDCGYTTFCC